MPRDKPDLSLGLLQGNLHGPSWDEFAPGLNGDRYWDDCRDSSSPERSRLREDHRSGKERLPHPDVHC